MISVISKVLVAAERTALCDLSDVKTELGIADTSQDAFLTRQIGVASAAIVQHVNRPLVSETVQDAFRRERAVDASHGSGGAECLRLSRYPVSTVSSVSQTGTILDEGADFVVDAAAGRLIRLDRAGSSVRWVSLPVTVTYRGGYDPMAVPPDLQDAAIRLVKARFFARGRDPMLRQETIPGVREASYWVASSDSGNLPPDVVDLLQGYRVPVTA